MAYRTLAVAAGLLAVGAIATPALAETIGGNPGASDGPIFIAVEGPQTGSQASNGQDMLRGVQLAVKQVNAKGGVLGRQVRIVKANDQANPSLAKKVAGQVISGSSVAVIGPYNSSVGLLNLPLYTSNKIVPVQLTSTDDTTGEGVTVQPKNSQISPIEFNYITTLGRCIEPLAAHLFPKIGELKSAITDHGCAGTRIRSWSSGGGRWGS